MNVPSDWRLANAPDLTGKTAIITGATGGLGLAAAAGLAARGATTVLTGRNAQKGARAIQRIAARFPQARIRFEPLDLASLAAVARFAGAWAGPLDILVNNAGVMALPSRQVTDDGFEQQMGVNYLAHFALTARLKAALNAASDGGRVVSVASLAHRRARLKLDDLQSERSYEPMGVYGQTKLAMLMFALELHRRAQEAGWALRSFAAHPGWARTEIIHNGPGGGHPGLKAKLMAAAFNALAQSAEAGALPILYAATAPDAQLGSYYGPSRLGETRGPPSLSRIFPQALDAQVSTRLWRLSEQLTGLTFG